MLKRINHPLVWGVLMMLAGAGGLVAQGALAGAGLPAYLALGLALVVLPVLTWTSRARWRGAEDRALGRIVVLALAVYGLVMAVMALVVGAGGLCALRRALCGRGGDAARAALCGADSAAHGLGGRQHGRA
jgi:hypothetical protein